MLTHYSRRALVFVVFVLGLSTAHAQAPKVHVHLLIVADGENFAGGARDRIYADGNSIEDVIGAQIPAEDLSVLEIDRNKQITRRSVLNAISNVEPAPNDVLVFYYSGHGAVDPRQGHYFQLSGNSDTLLRSDLRNALLSRNARLTVMITDCCAAILNLPRAAGAAAHAPAEKWSPLCKKLMKEGAGLVDFTSSTPPEFSFISKEKFGSIFTQCLCEEIVNNESRPMTWKELFGLTKGATVKQSLKERGEGGRQTPQLLRYEVMRLGVEAQGIQGGGVRIIRVADGFPAAKAGIEPGDVIVSWNGVPVRGSADFDRIVDESHGEVEVEVRNVRDRQIYSITIKLPN